MGEIIAEILYVFDFDGTLINTGKGDEEQKNIYKEKTGNDWGWSSWWDRKESLDTNIFTHTPIPDVVGIYNNVIDIPNILVVMLTGRKTNLSEYVEAVLKKNGLMDFDRYMYNYGGDTLTNKKDQIFDLVNEIDTIRKIVMYDDRDVHIPQFNIFCGELIKLGFIDEFNVFHVKDGKIR